MNYKDPLANFSKDLQKSIHKRNQEIKNSGGSPPYHDEIGTCCIAVSYSKENSIEKQGAIDTAEDNNVSLITYMDIYELVCLNGNFPLSSEELKKIFCFQEGKDAEAAVRIYDLIQQKIRK